MSYDEHDAAEEAFYERMYAEFRRDHADEIADEITTGEVIDGVLRAHEEWWPRTESELDRSNRRLSEGETEEALFHMGRAFDGYIKNVLVMPLRVALMERLQRFMPAGFPLKQDSLFKTISGLGSGSAFAEYAMSLLAASTENAESLIQEFRLLINGGAGPSWRDRDRSFHAPVEVSKEIARKLLDQANKILKAVATDIERLMEEERKNRERREFSSGRVAVLRQLAVLFDRDATADVKERYIIVPYNYDSLEDRGDVLRALVAAGYVARIDDENSKYFGDTRYRLTSEGREYYENAVVPRLAPRR